VYGSGGPPGVNSPSGSTAKTLILVALILDLLFALLFIFAIGLSALYFNVACNAVGSHCGFSIFGIIFVALGVIALVWVLLIWLLCYQPVSAGQYGEARGNTLMFAILAFLTLNIITAILLLVAWSKLSDAVNEGRMGGGGGMYAPVMAQPYGGPPPPYPAAQPYMTAPAPGVANYSPGATTFSTGAPPAAPLAPAGGLPPPCPRCGRPATWIPQYQRYYCFSDGLYV
jgi:hypothetical protein